MTSSTCEFCGRTLESDSDPLSADCGGDCWGCVGDCEFYGGQGFPPSVRKVREEIRLGLRKPDGTPKPYRRFASPDLERGE